MPAHPRSCATRAKSHTLFGNTFGFFVLAIFSKKFHAFHSLKIQIEFLYMIYKFTGKGLFFFAAFICFISVFLAPFGFLCIYMALKAHVKIEDDVFEYAMLSTKRIPFRSMKKIYLSRSVDARYKVGYAFVSFATVIPLVIEYVGENGRMKKVKFSLNYFQNSAEIVEKLQEKSGLKIELPE